MNWRRKAFLVNDYGKNPTWWAICRRCAKSPSVEDSRFCCPAVQSPQNQFTVATNFLWLKANKCKKTVPFVLSFGKLRAWLCCLGLCLCQPFKLSYCIIYSEMKCYDENYRDVLTMLLTLTFFNQTQLSTISVFM